jgi:hypothetical protein
MRIVLAVLAAALLAAGCQKKPPPPPPPNPVIGTWACTTTVDKATAKIDVTFAANGTLTTKMTITASMEGKRALAKLEAGGKWSSSLKGMTQSLRDIKVLASTLNGDKTDEGAASALVRTLSLDGRDMPITGLGESDLVYQTKAGVVTCKR